MTGVDPAVTAQRLHLLADGYTPLPVAGKAVYRPEWKTIPVDEAEVLSWEAHPDWPGIGIRTGRIVGVDIDVDDAALAEKIKTLALQVLGETPLVRIGRAPRMLLVYRTETPFRKKIALGIAGKIEALGDGQQFVAYGIHPDTRRPYTWPQADLMAVPAADVPLIVEQSLNAFLAAALDALGGPPPKPAPAPSPVPARAYSNGHDTTPDAADVLDALYAIPGDLEYDEWIRVGFALYAALGPSGYTHWALWSARSAKNVPATTAKKWPSFSQVRDIHPETLFYIARGHGWKPERERQAQGVEDLGIFRAKSDREHAAEPESREKEQDDDPWNHPDMGLFKRIKPPVPPLPAMAGPAIRQWIEDTAKGTGAPADYVATALLSAVAAMLGSGVTVRASETWKEPVILWTAQHGAPSTGKTPALKAGIAPALAIEADLVEGNRRIRADHAAERTVAKIKLAAWEDAVKTAVKSGEPVPPRPDVDPDAPLLERQIVVRDTTVEALTDILVANPTGVLLANDEMDGWLSNFSRYSNGSDRPRWLEMWNGGTLTVNRKGKPTVRIETACVSIAGGLVPDRMEALMDDNDDGLLARFLHVWPDPAPFTPVRGRPIPDNAAMIGYAGRIARRRGTPQSPLVIDMTPDAMAAFEAFRQEHHATANTLGSIDASWWGKGPGQVLRLATCLHMLEWAEAGGSAPVINAGQAARAIGLFRDYFWPHARAVFGAAGAGNAEVRLARKVLRAIASDGTPEVSSSELLRAHRSANAKEMTAAVDVLVDSGWLRQLPLVSHGGRAARRWSANPKLFEKG